MKRLIFFLLLLTGISCANAQEEYSASKIPKEIKAKANAVIRDYDLKIEVVSLDEVDVTEHKVITVLNEKGDSYADIVASFSPLESLESIDAMIYDAEGSQVKKIRKLDFLEYPAIRNAGVFSDEKIKGYRVQYHNYPYTVESTIQTTQHHTFQLPVFQPETGDDISIQHATCTVTVPDSLKLSYKCYHFDNKPEIKKGTSDEYKWTLDNIPVKKEEPYSYHGNFTYQAIVFSLNKFSLDDFTGKANTWKDLGTFIYQLNKNRDTLPYNVLADVNNIVSKLSDDKDKIAALYAYMQKNVRYVAVELGIGGWQTLEAGFVAKNQYGDCKALSNYMMSLLEAAGIKSDVVIIKAGVDEQSTLSKDFIVSQFNHVILCVPSAKDTVWLECTSADLPANYLSGFTQNRDALLVTPEGGYIVHTPTYDTSVNKTVHTASVSYKDDGSLKIDMRSIYKGEAAKDLFRELKYSDDNDKNEFLHSKFRLPSYTLDNYNYHRIDTASITTVDEQAKLTAMGMYTKSGNRSFLLLNLAPPRTYDAEEADERKTPFYIPLSSSLYDTFTVAIPAGTDVEFIPNPVHIEHDFGSYSFQIDKKGDALVVTSKFIRNSGIYPADQYNSFVKMEEMATEKSHTKVVLKNKQ